MKIKIDFSATGQPSAKMVSCMTWISNILQLSVEERVWWDYSKASEFISENIQEALDVQAIRYEQEKFLKLQPRWKYYIDD